MGTAGHVDHGKTALIKALTDIDCDTHKEEKKRGITINLGFSHLDLPLGDSIGIIDVPGHKDFINTMVGGACGIDFVLLVIAADSGIMPQTIEHFNIIKTLKINKGIIALTKIDLVDEDLIELAKLEILELLENTELEDAPIVGVSSITGKGVDNLIDTMQEIVPVIKEKENSGIFRMYIDRIFSVIGLGSIVTGSVLSGKISTGKNIFLLPGNKKLKIRSIERHGSQVEEVVAGDRAAINITGFKNEDFKRGMMLSGKILEETKIIDAHISLFENSQDLKLWSTIIFHSGTFESQARMHLLNKDILKGGQNAVVQIHLERSATLLTNDKFIIRNSSGNRTYGGGIIIDANPLHHRKRTPKLIENLTLLTNSILNENNINELIKIELKKENNPLPVSEIAEKINRSSDEIIAVLNDINDIIIYNDNDVFILIDKNKEEEYYNQIIQNIKAYHSKNMILEDGMEQNEFYGKLGFSKDKTGKKYIELLFLKIESDGKLKRYKNTWVDVNHKAVIDTKTIEDINWLEEMIKNYDMQKPVYEDIEDAAKEKNITKEKLKTYITYLFRKNKICFHKDEYVHISVIDKCRQTILESLIKNNKSLNNSEIRKLLETSKKLTHFLIAYFGSEEIISTKMVDTYIYINITNKGKEVLNESIS